VITLRGKFMLAVDSWPLRPHLNSPQNLIRGIFPNHVQNGQSATGMSCSPSVKSKHPLVRDHDQLALRNQPKDRLARNGGSFRHGEGMCFAVNEPCCRTRRLLRSPAAYRTVRASIHHSQDIQNFASFQFP